MRLYQTTRHALLTAALPLAVLAAVPTLGVVGCESMMSNKNPEMVSLKVTPKEATIRRGEIVTIDIDSTNALNKNVDVEWESTGGEFTQEKANMAQIKFDEAGEYTVTAKTTVDGKPQPAQLVRVNVMK